MDLRTLVSRRSPLALAALSTLVMACGGPDTSAQAESDSAGLSETPTGGAVVHAYINHSPVVAGMSAQEDLVAGTSGPGAMVLADVTVSVSDEDGDDLGYTWTTPDCPDAALTFPDPANHARVLVLAHAADACEIAVDVRDFWKGHLAPAGSGLPPARGGFAVARFRLSVPPGVNTADPQ